MAYVSLIQFEMGKWEIGDQNFELDFISSLETPTYLAETNCVT